MTLHQLLSCLLYSDECYRMCREGSQDVAFCLLHLRSPRHAGESVQVATARCHRRGPAPLHGSPALFSTGEAAAALGAAAGNGAALGNAQQCQPLPVSACPKCCLQMQRAEVRS